MLNFTLTVLTFVATRYSKQACSTLAAPKVNYKLKEIMCNYSGPSS